MSVLTEYVQSLPIRGAQPISQNRVNIWKLREDQLNRGEVFTFRARLIASVELQLDNRRQVRVVTALPVALRMFRNVLRCTAAVTYWT